MLIPPLPPTPSTTCSRHSQLKDPELSDKNSQYLVGQGNRTRTHMHTRTHTRVVAQLWFRSSFISRKINNKLLLLKEWRLEKKKEKLSKPFALDRFDSRKMRKFVFYFYEDLLIKNSNFEHFNQNQTGKKKIVASVYKPVAAFLH